MRRSVALVWMLAACVVTSCGNGSDPPSVSTTSTQGPAQSSDASVAAESALVTGLFLPDRVEGEVVPLIVLVPGGGWATADPTGLIPLARHLTSLGAAVSVITYRAGDDGVYFPDQPADVACAINESAGAARDIGLSVGEVTVVGHSAGAHLTSLVALRPDAFSAACGYSLVAPDHFVGIAGPYDVTQAARFAGALFGPDNTDPAGWVEANPVEHAHERPELDVLLIHGRADITVPMEFTDTFAVALDDGGHEVIVERPEGADHHSIYSAEMAGPLIAEWLDL